MTLWEISSEPQENLAPFGTNYVMVKLTARRQQSPTRRFYSGSIVVIKTSTKSGKIDSQTLLNKVKSGFSAALFIFLRKLSLQIFFNVLKTMTKSLNNMSALSIVVL